MELLITNAPVDLIEFGCDCAIRIGAPTDSGYVSRPLVCSGYIVVATPAFLERVGRPASVDDLLATPMALLSDFGKRRLGGRALPETYDFVCEGQRRSMRFEPVLASNEPDVLMNFVIQDSGCAIMFETLCREHLQSGELERVLPQWTIDADMDLSIIYTRRATSESKVRVFVEFLLARMREPPVNGATGRR